MSGGAMIWLEMETSFLAEVIKQSGWMLPVLQALHLTAMAVLGGAELMVNLRLLGLGLSEQTPANVIKDSRQLMRLGLVGLTASGFFIFLSEAVKLSNSVAFWFKLGLLLLTLLFIYGIRNPAILGRGNRGGGLVKFSAVVSLALWLTVAVTGRWIGFT